MFFTTICHKMPQNSDKIYALCKKGPPRVWYCNSRNCNSWYCNRRPVWMDKEGECSEGPGRARKMQSFFHRICYGKHQIVKPLCPELRRWFVDREPVGRKLNGLNCVTERPAVQQ
uniref:(northern house mosquito) hypothetical protein n=1 Tax=Culex pipiens TaxID=7175 RepID=A0A8D8AV42_CULPI